MIEARIDPNFDSWRGAARKLLGAATHPDDILWTDGTGPAALPMFAGKMPAASPAAVCVPAGFIAIAKTVSLHRSPDRWALLYRALFRLARENPHLLEIETDEEVHRLREMEKHVRRDLHKMHAFVRFRRIEQPDGCEQFVAFHRPDHLILPAAGPWFARRFAIMHWTIFTPDASVAWDTRSLHFGPGAPASVITQEDELEELWKTYYASIFNPARVKIAAMKKEMPVRHWRTLPETQIIDDLLHNASNRVEEMVRKSTPRKNPDGSMPAKSAAEFIPEPANRSLPALTAAARGCKGCALYCHATQTVFGQGPGSAALMLVGEQPGDQEDLTGQPFMGPAGQLLDEVLGQVGIDRAQCYVTNAVKHFKFERRGTRRIHAKPSAREVVACKPWLEAEVQTLKPRMILALGATAAQSMLGPAFRITQNRGQVLHNTPWAPWFMATFHPSALLRIPDAKLREQSLQQFTEDLQKAADQLHGGPQATGLDPRADAIGR
jgi:DNA polymerase